MPRGAKRKAPEPPLEEKAPKKIKLDLKYDKSKEENSILPDELLIQIFGQISREDVVQCR